MMIEVGTGEFGVEVDEDLRTDGVHTCVAVGLYSEEGITGLGHFVGPEETRHGIEAMIELIGEERVEPKELDAYLVGGAIDQLGDSPQNPGNLEAAYEVLQQQSVPVTKSYTGGTATRYMELYSDGDVEVGFETGSEEF